MAVMIPGELYLDDTHFSGGELRLFELLKTLPDEYYVFHSTHWNEKERKNTMSHRNYIQWGEADFTIFHPSYGLIVFEVKDGLISYKQNTGWIQENRKTGYQKTIDPMVQAEKSKYFFLRILEKKFAGPSPYPLCSAVWFTSVDKQCIDGSFPLNYQEELVLWLNDLSNTKNIEKALKRIYNFCSVQKRTATEELTQKVLSAIAPEFGTFQSMRSRAIASKALFHKMTLEQSYLLDYLEEQNEAAIHGVAGTGKTVLAVQKAQRLAENDRVMFLCFNRFLKEHLEQNHSQPNIDFYNLDTLLVKMTASPLPANTKEKDEAILDLLMNWEEYHFNYNHVIIDEGQDFKDDHLQALKDIVQSRKGCFYVFYDKNQFVNGLEFPEWLNHMECRLILSRNCRNTKEIALTSTRPIGIQEEKIKMRREEPSAFYTDVPKPTFFIVKDLQQMKEHLIKLLKKYTSAGIAKENIVILTCKTEKTSILTEKDFVLTSTYHLSKNRTDNRILFTTVRKFKGLEAEVVICIDIDEKTFQNSTEKMAFYVGTSRATTVLDLFSVGEASDISFALSGDKSLKGPRCLKMIRDKLCVKIGSDTDLV